MIDDDNKKSNKNNNVKKLTKLLEAFYTYIENNKNLVTNYGIKYDYGDIISTAFVESIVNEVVSKQMIKKPANEMDKKGRPFITAAENKEFKS